jgi:hypothetical protein
MTGMRGGESGGVGLEVATQLRPRDLAATHRQVAGPSCSALATGAE